MNESVYVTEELLDVLLNSVRRRKWCSKEEILPRKAIILIPTKQQQRGKWLKAVNHTQLKTLRIGEVKSVVADFKTLWSNIGKAAK